MKHITRTQCIAGRTSNAVGARDTTPIWIRHIKNSIARGEKKLLFGYGAFTISNHINDVVSSRYGRHGHIVQINSNTILRQLKANCARSFGLEYEGE